MSSTSGWPMQMHEIEKPLGTGYRAAASVAALFARRCSAAPLFSRSPGCRSPKVSCDPAAGRFRTTCFAAIKRLAQQGRRLSNSRLLGWGDTVTCARLQVQLPLSHAKAINSSSHLLGEVWSKSEGSGVTSFIVPGELRAWKVAQPVGDSAEKCEPANTQNSRCTIFVVRERRRGVEIRNSVEDSSEKCFTDVNLRHTRRKPCKT